MTFGPKNSFKLDRNFYPPSENFVSLHCQTAPTFFGRDNPNCSAADLPFTVFRLAMFGSIWLSSVCWSPSVNLGSEEECRVYGGWVKTPFQFEAICGPKFTSFWHDVGDPLQFAMHCPLNVCLVSLRRYRPLNLSLSCKIVEKRSFLGPICRGKGYPTFQTCIFKQHLLPTIWPEVSSATSAGSWRKRREKKEEERKNPWYMSEIA